MQSNLDESEMLASARRAAALDAFRVRLSDALRPLTDPTETQAEAARVLGEHLGVNRAAYFEVDGEAYEVAADYVDQVPRLTGRYPISSFGDKLLTAIRAGQVAVSEDVQADRDLSEAERIAYAGIQIGAFISVPLIKYDRLVSGLTVHSARPRAWTSSEIAVVKETAERTWAAVERARVERALIEGERRYRTLFDTIDEGFCIIQFFDGPHGPLSDYVHIEANPAYERHAGITNVVGRCLRELVPEEADLWLARYRPVLETGTPIRFEQDLVATGRRLDLAAFRIEPPERRQVAVLFNDISARWQAETALRESEEKLKVANARKDEFLAMLAHELRNPLAPIRNAVAVLKVVGSPEPRAQWARDVIERQTQHLTRLIDDLLDVSRITRGAVTLQRGAVDIASVVDRAIEACRPLLDERRQQLTVSTPGPPLQVDGDATRLVQIVSNLLNNAATYTPQGGHVWVTAGSDPSGKHAVISVRDDGVGIAPELLSSVFDLFTQGEPTLDRSQGGLGVGLTVVQHLVQLHQGSVEAKSDGRGRGSEFVVRLPLATPVPATPPPDETSTATGTAPIAQLRILVVEDNIDSGDMLAFLLKLSGHDVRTARDGAAGLEAAREFAPHVILCDIGLPRMDGYEFARRLRQENSLEQPLLIALTGYGQEDDRRRTREAGFDHHLTKPIAPDALEALLATAR